MLGKIPREDGILKLRAGNDIVDVAFIAGFILLINWLVQVYAFKGVPVSHMDSIDWRNCNYDKKLMPHIIYKSSKLQLEMAGITDEMCSNHELADENGFVMSYEEAYALIEKKYPGHIQVNENWKIT